MLYSESNSISKEYIFYRKFLTFLRTGRTLHFFFFISLVFFIVSFNKIEFQENGIFNLNSPLTLFFLTWCITTELDAYNRYQNYKMVKDLIYKNGFRGLIIKPFSKSSCQRDAASEAARQLDMTIKIEQYFYRMGYRWYHIIPSILIDNPKFFFTKNYWISTFFVPRYKSKYFCW